MTIVPHKTRIYKTHSAIRLKHISTFLRTTFNNVSSKVVKIQVIFIKQTMHKVSLVKLVCGAVALLATEVMSSSGSKLQKRGMGPGGPTIFSQNQQQIAGQPSSIFTKGPCKKLAQLKQSAVSAIVL
jgi:hypothetical protein